MVNTRATFKLFRSTSPNQSSPYTGCVLLDGKWYAIDAWVVESQEAGIARHFEGTVSGGKALARQMVKSAKEKAPEDLLTQLEDIDDIESLRKALP